MIRNFLSTPNVLGRLMIVLLFAGGVVFAGVFDGFVVETQASSCCDGGTNVSLFSSSDCCDDEVTCSYNSYSGHGKPRYCDLSDGTKCGSKCSGSRKCQTIGCHGWKG